MAFVWIQVWAPPPISHEIIMGDLPPGSQPAVRSSTMAHSTRIAQSHPSSGAIYNEDADALKGQHSVHSSAPYPSSQSFPQHQYSAQTTRGENFNMNPLVSALPDLSYQNYIPSQRQAANTFPLYPLPSGQQYMGSQTLSNPSNAQYSMNYQGQYSAMYNQGPSPPPPQIQPGASAAGNTFYQNQPFMGLQQQAYFAQTNHYNPQGQMYTQVPPVNYASQASYSGDNRYHVQQRGSEYLGVGVSSVGAGRSSSIASGASQSSVVRGPPRKPRQSGHAIWVGNLPPQTELMNLVLHVCKEAQGLESLFLISKSNCAFANFKDEEACSAAQAKIHDSRFQNVRLVSRLRRSSAVATPGIAVPSGPAALSPPNPPLARTPSPVQVSKSKDIESSTDQVQSESTYDDSSPKDKFFVVKSLTVEDLELSVRNGIWATQSHNEESLNQAFKSVDNVYLIFSANKSGEYFGYARMTSPINDDPAAAIEFAPKAQTVEDPELPKAIPTPATEFAPKGRIIDDSARGTIFWEVEREDDEEEDNESSRSDPSETTPSKAWGKPFKIEWISTTRLPFYRTRGLRNPWNSNREVKIARDGTELETSIGRRLISLFNRLPSPVAPQMSGQMMGYPNSHHFP